MSLGLLGDELDSWLAAREEDLVAFRRHLHSNPEPSGQEHATTELIGERLRVAGLDARVLSSSTGLICDVGDGPRVALRADIDAVAVEDAKDVSYRSQRPGVAHACGHDVHTTVVLGAGLYLAKRWPSAQRGLRLIFQPAEERVPGGALDVVADGGLSGVERIFGVHCDPKLDVGCVGLREGAITSAVDMAVVTLLGPGGHTARPERTVDMVSLAARVVTELPARVAARLGPEAPLRLVFGSLRSGDAPNVIPTRAVLQATVRTPSTVLWDALPGIVEEELRELVRVPGADFDLAYTRGVPPVVNDADAIAEARSGVVRALGRHAVAETVQSWGGDDFAWYTRQVPGAYMRLGTHDPADTGPRLDLHAGHFDVDERAIAAGVRLLVAVVDEHLRANATHGG